ncbi:MAG: ribonuclease HII [Hyphomicrobiales bacterium]
MTIKSIPTHPSFCEEEALHASGYALVAGVDEVGRGPLAGPVVAAAVILDPQHTPSGLNDSKKLTQSRREILFDEICATAHVAVASLSATQIDHLNIRGATLAAMVKAVMGLSDIPDYILIDGRDVPDALTIPAKAIIKGDGHSLSIAAASIVAKVARDHMMIAADKHYPGYDFYKHKGYGSAHHRNAIQRLGPCPLHRRSFQPVKGMTGWVKN